MTDIFDKSSKVNSIFRDWQHDPKDFHFVIKAISELWQAEEDKLRSKYKADIIQAKSQINLFE